MYSISIETCYTLVHHYMAAALSAFSEVEKLFAEKGIKRCTRAVNMELSMTVQF
jgi:hypothetical protein